MKKQLRWNKPRINNSNLIFLHRRASLSQGVYPDIRRSPHLVPKQLPAMLAWSRRPDPKPRGLNSKVCVAMPKGSWAGAVSKKEEWMGLVGSEFRTFLNQLDTLPCHSGITIPTVGIGEEGIFMQFCSQVWSYSLLCGQLPVPRES